MADLQRTISHPVFQAREGKTDLATAYLLWMMADKTVIKLSGCWAWGGARNHGDYGLIEVAGKIHRVSRVIYEHCIAPLPADALVLHLCDNPPCCNPAHLYAGDHQDNALDFVKRCRHPLILLTEDMVREIRRRAAGPPRWSVKSLAERFGVTPDTIRDVLNRRSWGHVE